MSERSPPAALSDADRLRERVASGRLVAMTDFDGTLAEIVEQPEDAAMREDARRALRRLADAPDTDVAVVSGRALADLRDRVGLDGVAYAGNHGLEIEAGDRSRVHPDAADAADAVTAALEAVADACADVHGVRIEDKRLTGTVHYRQVEDDAAVERVREAVRSAVADVDELELHEAKQALELRPAVDWHKGRAVEWLVEELADGDAAALYAGDDVTDEDAHRAIGDDGVTVHVGDAETAAEWRLPDPEAVAQLFDWIAALRSPAAD